MEQVFGNVSKDIRMQLVVPKRKGKQLATRHAREPTTRRLDAIEQCFTVGDIRDHSMSNFIRDEAGKRRPYEERVLLQNDYYRRAVITSIIMVNLF
jgi:hypothetical protein